MSSFQLWPSLSQSIRRRRKPSCNGKNIVTLKTFIMIYSPGIPKLPWARRGPRYWRETMRIRAKTRERKNNLYFV